MNSEMAYELYRADTDALPGMGRRVLLVDDDPIQRKLTQVQLASAGFNVWSTGGASDALATLTHVRPDVIVSDVLMEDLDGFSLCRKLRSNPALAEVPILLLSAHFQGSGDQKLADAVGASALVERTPTFQRELEVLVATLAGDAPPSGDRSPDSSISQLYARSVTSQHVRLLDKYRSLLENIPDVIWSSSEEGKITFIGPNVTRVTGFTTREILTEEGNFLVERAHAEDAPGLKEAHHALFAQGKPFDIEYRWKHDNGTWIWLHSRAVAARDHDGNIYVDGVFSDVTARKRLEEQLRQSQKMEAIGQLTGGVAHDFNNILATILANCHFLLEDLAEDDRRRVDAEEIHKAAERAVVLTKQLLAFSRRQVLRPTIVNLDTVVGGVERMFRRVISETIELSVLGTKGLGSVRVDPGQVEQVILNLVVNARDAMPTGGKLTIETSNVELDEDYAAAHLSVAPGPYVMLAVSDSGAGMDAETKRKIFEPFFTTKKQGTGLGLSTSYGIVRQSGGAIWVYSEPGHGSVFKVYFPRVDCPAEVSSPATDPKGPGYAGSETILVVEDDPKVRAVVLRALGTKGYRVLSAQNGAEACAMAEAHAGALHLVLSDMVVPGLSGAQIVSRVQQYSAKTKALFMSGYTDHAIFDGALQNGANFIQKPFTPETLARRVREVLDV
jgi:two-component system cell cycle sensor histidine kinase/response regulator CckA